MSTKTLICAYIFQVMLVTQKALHQAMHTTTEFAHNYVVEMPL